MGAMRLFRSHSRLTGWIAVVAIFLASIAPSMSHALASANGSSWIEVCTAQGSKWTEDGADDTTPVSSPSHVFEHCPFCSIHSPAIGMPPSAEKASMPVEGHGEFPAAFYAAPCRLYAWVSAWPRAPPQFS